MSEVDNPMDADDLLMLAERIIDLPESDAEWVGSLLQELMRARHSEAELLARQVNDREQAAQPAGGVDEQMAQVALDTAEWLRTLWEVGYMGAGSFRANPRSSFPSIDLEDVMKSSLFARIRAGKRALPFPPPTRRGLPWHELLEGLEQAHTVEAELIRDETGLPLAAIIEGCSDWQIIEGASENREVLVQHQGKGPTFRLQPLDGFTAHLRREPPRSTRRIHLQGRAGFRSYTLEWPQQDGRTLLVALRAATWERAYSEAEHWLATAHPELYGQIRFEGYED